MNDYMRALHQRFFQEPDCTEIHRELETLHLTLRDKLDRQDREALLKLTDLAIELREDVSLASFTAGFQLGLGIAGELTPPLRRCFSGFFHDVSPRVAPHVFIYVFIYDISRPH